MFAETRFDLCGLSTVASAPLLLRFRLVQVGAGWCSCPRSMSNASPASSTSGATATVLLLCNCCCGLALCALHNAPGAGTCTACAAGMLLRSSSGSSPDVLRSSFAAGFRAAPGRVSVLMLTCACGMHGCKLPTTGIACCCWPGAGAAAAAALVASILASLDAQAANTTSRASMTTCSGSDDAGSKQLFNCCLLMHI